MKFENFVHSKNIKEHHLDLSRHALQLNYRQILFFKSQLKSYVVVAFPGHLNAPVSNPRHQKEKENHISKASFDNRLRLLLKSG